MESSGKQYYIGCKQIEAWPEANDGQEGYAVLYPDGYVSWSPKETFESAYLAMGEGSDGSRVSEAMVESFVARYEDHKIAEGTTLVIAHLRNGFKIIETSSAVDPANYDHAMGVEICKGRVKPQIWRLLGFLLASARNGVAG